MSLCQREPLNTSMFYLKAALPSSWMSRMTQSSDREHRTPLSPVRRHESIPGLIHAFTPEPANLTALLSRRPKTPLSVIENDDVPS